ncbi:MAG TPA: TlpA disulfide reductase family protein [Burkholderiaceae bacterium]|nr:TlpA disulfide reductase family protein [Burkholderiaceae bacterium]
MRRHPAWRTLAMVAMVSLPALGGLCGLCGPAQALERGEQAPSLKLPDLSGKAQALHKPQARLTYLDFWASWCGPCRQSFPFMNELQARYGAQGLRVVAVNLDAQTGDAQRFLAQMPAQFEVLLDPAGESARQYAVRGMPSSALIGADGRVLRWHQGFRAEDRAELEKAIKNALGGQP